MLACVFNSSWAHTCTCTCTCIVHVQYSTVHVHKNHGLPVKFPPCQNHRITQVQDYMYTVNVYMYFFLPVHV